MPTTLYSVELDGVTDFEDVQGNIYSWGSESYIQYAAFEEGNGNDLDATFNLSGSNWSLTYLHTWSAAGGILRVTDVDFGSGRYIRHLTLNEDSIVRLNTTYVDVIDDGSSTAASHDVKLGLAGAKLINLYADENRVETGSGFVGSINTRGLDTVHIYGGAHSVDTGDQDDEIGLFGGFTGLVEAGSGNDLFGAVGGGGGRVNLADGNDSAYLLSGFVDLLIMGIGDDTVVANGGGAGEVRFDDGNDIVTVRGGSRINSVDAGQGDATILVEAGRIDRIQIHQGTHSIESQGDGRIDEISGSNSTLSLLTETGFINHINFWRSDTDINLGSAGAASIELFSDQAQTHGVVSSGWIRSIDMGDGQTMDLVLRDAGGGRVSLGDLDDAVLVENGARVDFINTREGDDTIRVQSNGYVETIDVQQGDDSVLIDGRGVGTLRLGSGNDTLLVAGESFVRTLDGFEGNKSIVVTDNAGIDGIELSSGLATIEVQSSNARIGMMNLSELDSSIVTVGSHANINGWRGSHDITIGTGGAVSTMTFYSDFNVSQTIVVNGWAGAIQTGDLVESEIVVRGGAGTIRLAGEDDTVDARGGWVEYISTGGGNDTVLGSDADDFIFGGGGNDWLRGGTGIDEITGGSGADTFVFFVGDGTLIIKDFAPGVDDLALGSLAAGFSVQDLLPYVSQEGSDVIIRSGSQEVRFEDTLLTDLSAGDVIFV